MKINYYGDTLWTYVFPSGSFYQAICNSVVQANDNGYFLVGYLPGGFGNHDLLYVKLDSNGVQEWFDIIHYGAGQSDNTSAISVCHSLDGGYLISGSASNSGVGGGYLVKIDEMGVIKWQKAFATYGTFFSIIQLPDSGFIITGVAIDTVPNHSDMLLLKIDSLGNEIWHKSFNKNTFPRSDEIGHQIIQTSDGGFIIVGETSFQDTSGFYWDEYIIKTNNFGDTLWTKVISNSPVNNLERGFSIVEARDGGYVIAGSNNAVGGARLIITKLSSSGEMVWQNNVGNNIGEATSIIRATDDTYFVTGLINDTITWDGKVLLMKFKDFTNVISGRVYADMDLDCTFSIGDFGLKGILVKAEPGLAYGITDDSGYYYIYVDTGTYAVSKVSEIPLWDTDCSSAPYIVSFTTPYDTSFGNDFGIKASQSCTKLWIDISGTNLRRCSAARYYVNYCNYGSTAENNSVVTIDFGSGVTPVSSSFPWSSFQGAIYSFNTGVLAPGQCESFFVDVTISCAAIIGSSKCVRAAILPYIICSLPDTSAQIELLNLEGSCVNNDSIRFRIRNDAAINFIHSGIYSIYENNVLTLQGTFYLPPGDSMEIFYPANGNTLRCELKMMFLPDTFLIQGPSVDFEGCGNILVYGEIGQLPLNDDADYFEESCREITGSFDPNDKQVSPSGITAAHYVSPNTEMEYQINFQNTGNDTAFYVMIRDTISPYLDISTLQSGTSSHDYIFNVYGDGIAEWVFPLIMLPDSNVDEPSSHGFVKYKINQLPGNLYGTVIQNNALIYFDFNEPVVTNVTENIVCDLPISNFTYSINEGEVQFTNSSANSQFYVWNFGDSLFDFTANPLHTFSINGQYHVCLIASNDCESGISCQTITLTSVGVRENNFRGDVNVEPNPFTDKINLSFDVLPLRKYSAIKISIYNSIGKKLLEKGMTAFAQQLDLSFLQSGIYFLQVETEAGVFQRKLVKI